MFIPSEIAILRNAVEKLRNQDRCDIMDMMGLPIYEDTRIEAENRISQYTQLLAKLKSPAMYSRG